MQNKDWLKYLLFLFGSSFALYFFYIFFTPIGFFFISGIFFSVIFFLIVRIQRPPKGSLNSKKKITLFAKISALILVTLFILSIIVLQSYQRPSGDQPYFSNVDHYAIQNTGIGFDQSLNLYSPDFSENGLWKSDTGTLEVKIKNHISALQFNHFCTPVFRINSEPDNSPVLINPTWKAAISNGFSISNGTSSLRWMNFESKQNDRYAMDIIFCTNDSILLEANSRKRIVDTFHIDAKIKKGLSLIDLFQTTDRHLKENDEDFSSFSKAESSLLINGVVYQWLNSIGKLEIIASSQSNKDKKSLFLQPSAKVLEQGYQCDVQGNRVPIAISQSFIFSWSDKFYVGLGKSEYPFQIIQNSLDQPKPHLLSFYGEQNLIPFYFVPANKLIRGQKILRFLKNAPDLGDTSLQLNEGFVFQKRMKNNIQTQVKGGLIEIESDLTGIPLKWRSSFEKYNFGPGDFTLKSYSDNLLWYYRITDLSDNWYKFDIVKYFLFFVIVIMIVIVFYFPSQTNILIETPLFIFIYCFLVFRYLLAWRIATFPPLENIKKYELENTLQRFDYPSCFPISYSFIFIIIFLVLLIISRVSIVKTKFIMIGHKFDKKNSTTALFKFINTLKFRWSIFYFFYLLLCFVLSRLGLERIATIVFPLWGYFFFIYKAVQSPSKIKYEGFTSKWAKWYKQFILFCDILFETEMTVINLLAFSYFVFADKGFAVFFLIFILIRFIFFSLFQSSSLKIYDKRKINWRMCAACFVTVILAFLLFYKGTIYWALKYITYILAIGLFFVSLLIYILKLTKRVKIFLCFLFLLLAFFLVIPLTSSKINKLILKEIKNTKFRSELIYKPLEDVLLENEFQSDHESKIIETAQNQWYIHSYLKDAQFLNPLKSSERIINFRPHSRIGVDYTTQTRDVVLPRYVIGEFGGFTMLILLFFCTLPLILFLSGYRISGKNKTLIPDASLGLMSLLFLFTIALMLWLTSTNRFAFFGQDFPFMSITSRIAVLLPVSLVLIVLLCEPIQLSVIDTRHAKNSYIIFFSLSFILLVFTISKRSTLIADEKFHVNFSRVENNINYSINKILSEVQDKLNLPLLEDEDLPPEDWLPDIKKVINGLTQNTDFIKLKDSFSVYESGIWNKIYSDPSLGLTINSPVHFKVQNGKMTCQFNNYWKMELPLYNEKKVWRGNVSQEAFEGKVNFNGYLKEVDGIKLLSIPSDFTEQKQPLAILDLQGGANLVAYLYNLKTKSLTEVRPQSDAKLIDTNHIVLWRNGMDDIKSFNVTGKTDSYFAQNILLNGKQQFAYPLGSKLFWARHWALAVKKQFEREGTSELQPEYQITLDYNLSKEVGVFLENDFRKVLNKNIPTIKDPSFSVIVADGDGKIRLMNDFAMQREVIDPNNEQEILKEQLHDYFYINTARERLQWGNLNLLRMKLGPASSFKPLMAASIVSQANANWQALDLISVSNNKPDLNFDKGINIYASETIKPSWKGLSLDNKESQTNFQQYIYKSNNIFNSVMIFLGSYTKNAIQQAGGKISGLMRPISIVGPQTFPHIKIGNQNYELRDRNGWPRSSDSYSYFGHEKSLLSLGLKQCMGLSTDVDNGLSLQEKKYLFSVINDSSTWGSPESSYMLLSNRIDKSWQSNFNKAIRNTSLGSAGIFEVTPVSMVEMYGRLVTMNAGYKLTIDKTRSKNADWKPSSDWTGNYEGFHYNVLLNAMKKTITDGTADKLKNWTSLNNKYYYYAKTGTGGSENAKGKDKNSKRLALVISKNELTSKASSNKFYIVYFTFDNARTDQNQDETWIYEEIYKPILNKIITSISFKNYMQ